MTNVEETIVNKRLSGVSHKIGMLARMSDDVEWKAYDELFDAAWWDLYDKKHFGTDRIRLVRAFTKHFISKDGFFYGQSLVVSYLNRLFKFAENLAKELDDQKTWIDTFKTVLKQHKLFGADDQKEDAGEEKVEPGRSHPSPPLIRMGPTPQIIINRAKQCLADIVKRGGILNSGDYAETIEALEEACDFHGADFPEIEELLDDFYFYREKGPINQKLKETI